MTSFGKELKDHFKSLASTLQLLQMLALEVHLDVKQVTIQINHLLLARRIHRLKIHIYFVSIVSTEGFVFPITNVIHEKIIIPLHFLLSEFNHTEIVIKINDASM